MKIPEKNTNDIIVIQPAPMEIVLAVINDELAPTPKKNQKSDPLPPKITMVG